MQMIFFVFILIEIHNHLEAFYGAAVWPVTLAQAMEVSF